MGKSKLEKRVDGLGLMVRVAIACVVLLGFVMLVGHVEDKESVAIPAGSVLIRDGGDTAPAPILEASHGGETVTSEEPVSDALAVATMNDYAKLEAGRIAKMAAVIMDMGGKYEATCAAEYNTSTEKTETTYFITWFRKGMGVEEAKEKGIDVIGRAEFVKSWKGATWAECIQEMLAWKGGSDE